MKPTKLFVAIDVPDLQSVYTVVTTTKKYVDGAKIGLEAMNGIGTPVVVDMLSELGVKIMLDPKLHDIPKTVGNTAKVLSRYARLGVELFTVHASGGVEMMRAAIDNAGDCQVFAVTILTSLDDVRCKATYGKGCLDKVFELAQDAWLAGVAGLICSPQELPRLRSVPDFDAMQIITPGIRLSDTSLGDQQRVATPTFAVENGANGIVVGRPIHSNENGLSPAEAAKMIAQELQAAAPEACHHDDVV